MGTVVTAKGLPRYPRSTRSSASSPSRGKRGRTPLRSEGTHLCGEVSQDRTSTTASLVMQISSTATTTMGDVMKLVRDDITKYPADIIVNAANSRLAHGGGVAAAIARAAGPALIKESENHPEVPTGEVVYTTAGDLHAKYVIHAVGPVYEGGSSGEAEKLRSCIVNALNLAEKLGASSIAFPAISTGIYGYPIEEAAEIMVGAVRKYEGAGGHLDVSFVLFSESDLQVFRKVLDDL